MTGIEDGGILIGQHAHAKGANPCFLRPDRANRHGLITGATGTGKTITLQTLAEGFSNLGVPVFMADVKGDLSGVSQAGTLGDKLAKVLAARGLATPAFAAFPTTLWDVLGAQGHPVRATVSDLGPLLLARMLDLNETQAGVLQLVFKIADDDGLLLLDLKDLRAMCQHVGDNASTYTTEYGNVSAASIGAIQRGLLQVEAQGGDRFFGEPTKSIIRLLQSIGRGLRVSAKKKTLKVYDIVDDLCWLKHKNHIFRHFEERVKIYKKEKFDYKIFSMTLKDALKDK